MTTAAKQTWSADRYDRNARFVSDLGADVLGWLAPVPGERILDLGCGDGALTMRIADAGASVVGVDASASMVEAARSLGLDAHIADGESLAFDREFDAVFSNAALHWMTDMAAVISGVRRALKPGGRFVAELGGLGNVAAIATAMRGVALARGGDPELAHPWAFPSADVYQALLEGEGFAVRRIALIPRPTPLPTEMSGWLETFRAPFFDQFGTDRHTALADTVALLAPSLRDAEGRWTADYVRLRVEAALEK